MDEGRFRPCFGQRAAAPLEDRADSGDDFAGREGFDDVVVPAQLEPQDAIDLVVSR
jgi:hypothetical protein